MDGGFIWPCRTFRSCRVVFTCFQNRFVVSYVTGATSGLALVWQTVYLFPTSHLSKYLNTFILGISRTDFKKALYSCSPQSFRRKHAPRSCCPHKFKGYLQGLSPIEDASLCRGTFASFSNVSALSRHSASSINLLSSSR